MRAAAGWRTKADYARFLSLQYAARLPVEAWLAQHAPADLCPPAQCDLIAADLSELGEPLPRAAASFRLDGTTRDPHTAACEALGAAWVLAGSSLGNRAILGEVRRTAKITAQAANCAANGGAQWPASFLGDEQMLSFWKDLRARIERPAEITEVEAASRAAAAVFDHFTTIATKETHAA